VDAHHGIVDGQGYPCANLDRYSRDVLSVQALEVVGTPSPDCGGHFSGTLVHGFFIAVRWQKDRIHEPSIQFAEPSFISSAPGTPGSKVLFKLFLYGLVGVFGNRVIAIGTARFRFRLAQGLVNATVSALLFASLTTVFYLRYCDKQGIFMRHRDSKFAYLNGTLYMDLQNMEPYVLTNPRAYPGLALSDVNDQVLREWIEDQYAKISSLDSKRGPDGESEAIRR
jgi:hypothetical protein